jgi:hypothetical protein
MQKLEWLDHNQNTLPRSTLPWCFKARNSVFKNVKAALHDQEELIANILKLIALDREMILI